MSREATRSKMELRSISKFCFAACYDVVMTRYERHMQQCRADLVGQAEGVVLEIGPGTGANLPWYQRADCWMGIEPNRYMCQRLRAKIDRKGQDWGCRVWQPQVLEGSAEQLPVDDSSVDSVVSTLVLCSVKSQQLALREILRVLRPSGRLLFLEHVVDPTSQTGRLVQRSVRLPWRLCAGGCRTDRDTLTAIREAGFAEVEATAWRVPFPVVPPFLSPHIMGIATK